ncbi:MAG: hypothetical protein HY700_03500 [Gemmatimonadetes bacterium]|nr:hypothetical protein [Gemmatimonadota bacterium]
MTRIFAIGLLAVAGSPHLADQDTYFQGRAGPYAVRVVVETPGVIPGLATIQITISNPDPVQQVTVQPLAWSVPAEQAPAADLAKATENPGEYQAHLWLMISGSYGVRVTIRGEAGAGAVTVPVSAVAYQRLDIPRPLAAALLGLATFLTLGLVTIVRSAARASTLAPGEAPDSRARKRGWMGLVSGCVLVAALLIGGRAWWSAVDSQYRQRLYRAPQVKAAISDRPGILTIAVQDSTWVQRRRRFPLATDEGKMAHVFLIGDSATGGFAHLHPFAANGGTFEVALPPLPSGHYRLFTEVTDSVGFTQIMPGTIDIPAATRGTSRRAPVPDGFWLIGGETSRCPAVPITALCRVVTDGSAIDLRPGPVLRFSLRNARAEPLAVDWSSDESADAVLLESGGRMTHLRPHGTPSRAAIAHFAPEQAGWRSDEPGEVDFPYPLSDFQGGRIWLLVRTGGKLMGAAFDIGAEGR